VRPARNRARPRSRAARRAGELMTGADVALLTDRRYTAETAAPEDW
jgi:hypothetical protein